VRRIEKLASLMVITCYYALNLTDTLFIAASTAADVSFLGLFSALNLGVPLLVCVICWWRASAEPMVLAVGIFSFSYLVMLMLAKIVSCE
jgi:hypothetical protein